MKLGALSISDYAAERLGAHGSTGSVHSVFRTSLNVEFDGLLLHIGSARAPLSCLGLTVDPEGASALVNLVDPGDRALVRNGILRLYGRGDVVEIDLISAPVRGTAVPMATVSPDEEMDILVCRELSELSLPARTGLPWDERASRSLAGLARLSAVCRSSWEAARTDAPAPRARIDAAYRGAGGAIRHLLGRGLGLTPSGDDVLCGFGCGFCYLWRRAPLGCDGWKVYADMVLEALPGKTTAVSEGYLRAMCEGFANEDYVDLLRSLDGGEVEKVPGHLERILEMGHTSGADSLLGFGAAFGYISI
ncbi:MAG: DUF2877 domain-containing protein [Coriobacteriaceae bacterium]|nr:DUF2877 domain-containing protein [Coriobacteriaceae bacterium]